MTAPMPALYLSHGAPPLADDRLWTGQLAAWAGDLPRPRAVLVVSAHWEEAPVTLGATETVPLTYDFWGFARRYFEVTYEAPGAPGLAREVRALLGTSGHEVHDAPERGLDHGAYVPLKEMYPDADVPVLQVSMPSLRPDELYAMGRRLRPLRDAGVLIVGSGFTTHNLGLIDMRRSSGVAPGAWSHEFDHWAAETMTAGDVDSLLRFEERAPAAGIAHPTTDHFAPLFVTLGASDDTEKRSSTIDGYWYGLSKRSWQIG